MLVPVLKHNLALQSLNLDSNCLTGSGIKVTHTVIIFCSYICIIKYSKSNKLYCEALAMCI